jgi:phosphopantothenoylcysteine decarboxylase / phosphopantothenate---cysteine ligase
MNDRSAAARPHVVVGVAGGIAAYKALEVIRLFAEANYSVQVLPTLSALRFVGEASFAALSGNKVATDVWSDVENVPHVTIGRSADLVVVVPATADLIARAAAGRADDLLTATLLTATCPVLFAPAMHTEMWENLATVANVKTLRDRGIDVLEPASGRLTGADTGKGRLSDPIEIFEAAELLLAAKLPNYAGKKVLVTAGGTREPLDPVRYLGNNSSGKQGYAFAKVLCAAGAEVTLISANSLLADPAGVTVVKVKTADELFEAVKLEQQSADVVIMAAAVADFRPANYQKAKLKKTEVKNIELESTVDILAWLGEHKPQGQVLVGFAAETGDDSKSAIDYATAKLAAKNCDFLVMNSVADGEVFGSDSNEVTVLKTGGEQHQIPTTSKLNVAVTVCHLVIS